MQLRSVFFIIGVLLICLGTSIIFPLLTSIYYNDGVTKDLVLSLSIVIISGLLLTFICHQNTPIILSNQEGFAVVGLCWIIASIAGSLPYVYIGIPFTDAVFETASGFTTTGATILTDIETIPKSILLWRSLTHWLGGMGIILLSLAVLPLLGVGGMQLYKAEVPGPSPDKLTPHMQDTAMLLWKVYGIMTLSQIILLYLAGMDLFDAINQTFSTVSTGGFSTKNNSIAAFPTPIIQWIIILFMFASGINFTLHYKLLLGLPPHYTHDTEFNLYTLLLIIGSITIGVLLIFYHIYPSNTFIQIEQIIRASVFQLVSICTTTGFITEDYSKWPQLAQGILLFFMFMGSCAGSTAGGLKTMRIIVIAKVAYQEIFRLLHPHSIRFAKLGDKTIQKDVLSGIIGFLILYLFILLLNTLALMALNYDLVTSFSATLTCLSNVGPGFGSVGPVDNFHHIDKLAKWLLTFCMLLGRLEIYAILILFIPEFWKALK